MPDRDVPAVPRFLPYGRQQIGDADIKAVVEALCSDWLTTGPRVAQFENAFARFCGAAHGVAVNSGTAALHAAMRGIGVGPGDEVIVPALTFAASANAAVYEGATPVFADVEADTLLIDPKSVAARITPRTKAIVAVDYAGQPADYDALRAAAPGLPIVADACHAPGATYNGRKVGTLADISCFSFHPVKHLTTCEGGMCLTENAEMAAHMRRFRNHGIDSDHRARDAAGTFAYDMVELGYNYRLPDVQCALGMAQLLRLPEWLLARRAVAAAYAKAFAEVPHATPLAQREGREHAYHLYVVRLAPKIDRGAAFRRLRGHGIGVNVHYGPVHLMTFYRERGYGPGLCPVAEEAAEHILTLPMFPAMSRSDVARVVEAVAELD
ncbi:MAG: aminotransferase class I/II-fold pyridoxal phosphate-dependent enzyme [Alphaproteobacteria bacterium]|nr:aminotransferase class I/II-fold pyridoxal phosphate-dependent enzyme [Alphaproteobacteria bacterium]MBU6472251.1 aminotransferase class I/II-fold pyridoxal phosphate-dependent enzyme [Alphaproteobacteria bacterium]MDE2011788.1 aminotransferase class I/II-fold pyridoxal phosphate-dependent enzyme [Alphaproteobacteria bacterium]MDE2073810.1 aminotransferase class I/II-fold pyridoxal phosphate-dependent enzyme [Alphaproteobacteria bacterium]MDE2351963.1 aminotransferase class I/II-fold pyridox